MEVTVQPSTVPRGVALHLQDNLEAATRQIAVFAVCVHAFVAMKPKGWIVTGELLRAGHRVNNSQQAAEGRNS